MINQIEEETIKNKLNYAMILGILYLISALWLRWWQNITGKSPLLFIGLIYSAFLVLRLTSRKKMIIVNFIVFILAVRLLLKYIPRLFLVGEPHFFVFYLFLICIPLLHIFFLLNPLLNQFFIFEKGEIQKIDEMVQYRRIVLKRTVLIFILFFLSSWVLFSNKIIKIPSVDGHLIQSQNMQFFLRGNKNKVVVAEPYINILQQYVYFDEYHFKLLDNEDRLLCVFYSMDYDLKSGIISSDSFETTVGKSKFYIGKGEILNGKFKAIFPEGTKLSLLTDVAWGEFGEEDMLLIKLPYPFEKLKLQKAN